MELSNVIAGDLTFRVQRMNNFPPFGMEFYTLQPDGTESPEPMDLSTLQDIRMTIVDPWGKSVIEYALSTGVGLSLSDNSETGTTNTILVISKEYDEDNIRPMTYTYDILLVASDSEAQTPIKGNFIVVENKTS